MSGRKVAKRACDACKVRKIRCSEIQPCEGCLSSGVACTFVKTPHTRGPRRLRKTTLDEIRRTQQQWEESGLVAATVTPEPQPTVLTEETVFAPSKVASLVLQLCIYRLRMYPVWPIIKVERLVAALQKPLPDIEVFALAYAVAAATIAQIKTKASSMPGTITAEMMEAQCQYAKAKRDASEPPNITTVRIAFFLHIYYENQNPGGLKSILYLREAISIAQVLGLHRESYYKNVILEEQQIRRRTLWLLFVTERGVSILHKLPVILKTKIAFPSTQDTDEADVLAAFQKLIGLFWSFDQSGVFELLDSVDFDLSAFSPSTSTDIDLLCSVGQQLEATVIDSEGIGDVQAVDIAVTRQWMRVILWRLAESQGMFVAPTPNNSSPLHDPTEIAKEFLAAIQQMPDTAIEAHGPGLELKIFEIASSVVDAVVLGVSSNKSQNAGNSGSPEDVLARLQRLLMRNEKLDSMLCTKIATVQQNQHLLIGLNTGPLSSSSDVGHQTHAMDLDIDQQLQAHGFDFSEPLQVGVSPSEDSLGSENSPMPNFSSDVQRHLSSSSNGQTPSWNRQQAASSQISGQDSMLMWSQPHNLVPGLENIDHTFGQNQGFSYGMDAFSADPSFGSFGMPNTGWTPNH